MIDSVSAKQCLLALAGALVPLGRLVPSGRPVPLGTLGNGLRLGGPDYVGQHGMR